MAMKLMHSGYVSRDCRLPLFIRQILVPIPAVYKTRALSRLCRCPATEFHDSHHHNNDNIIICSSTIKIELLLLYKTHFSFWCFTWDSFSVGNMYLLFLWSYLKRFMFEICIEKNYLLGINYLAVRAWNSNIFHESLKR